LDDSAEKYELGRKTIVAYQKVLCQHFNAVPGKNNEEGHTVCIMWPSFTESISWYTFKYTYRKTHRQKDNYR